MLVSIDARRQTQVMRLKTADGKNDAGRPDRLSMGKRPPVAEPQKKNQLKSSAGRGKTSVINNAACKNTPKTTEKTQPLLSPLHMHVRDPGRYLCRMTKKPRSGRKKNNMDGDADAPDFFAKG